MEPESRNEPTSPQECRSNPREDFITSLRRGVRFLGMMGASAILIYPFWPMFPPPGGLPKPVPRSLIAEDYAIDCYIARDASGSPNSAVYSEIEREILRHLSYDDGDRISYARFGSVTEPPRIPPPSRNKETVQALMSSAPNPYLKSKTDFDLLFRRLREAIARERKVARSSRPEQHTDVMIILSDGVPDTEGHNLRCPHEFDQIGKPFIPEAVRSSFEALMKSSHAANERLMIFIVLAGENIRCAPEITEEWEIALGHIGLRVVSYAELKAHPDLGPRLFDGVQRHQCTYFAPTWMQFEDEQRRNLERGKPFSASISVWSHMNAQAIARINRAQLLDNPGQTVLATLYVVEDSNIPINQSGGVQIAVGSPADSRLRGPVATRPLTFRFDPDEFKGLRLEPAESYRLRVQPEVATGSVQVEDFFIGRSRWTEQAAKAERRLLRLALLAIPVCLGYVFFAVWYFLRWSRRGGGIAVIEKFFIQPFRYWLYTFFFILTFLVISVILLRQTLTPWLAVPTFLTVVYFSQKGRKREASWSRIAILLGNYVSALHLLIDLASAFLVEFLASRLLG